MQYVRRNSRRRRKSGHNYAHARRGDEPLERRHGDSPRSWGNTSAIADALAADSRSFPGIGAESRDGETLAAVSANVSANLLGLGNAATPLAIDALRNFQESVPDNGRASDDSVMLTVLSTAAFSFVPTTMLALRQAAGAKIMFELLPAVWMNGIIGSLSAVILTKLLCKIDKRWRKRP